MISLGCRIDCMLSFSILNHHHVTNLPQGNRRPSPPSSHPNDMHRGESGDQGTSDLLQSPRPSRRVLDNLKDFTYDPIEQSRDPLDTWPGQVEMRPRRRSTLLSSLIRGNQPHRSFFGEDDESEPTAAVKNQLSRPLNNARRLSKTAVSALKEKVPLPPLPWKQKRSLSQSANSRARAYQTHPPFAVLI